MVRIKGSISIVDLTDSRSLVAYISSTNRRQVIYDPNEDVYLPNYSEDPNTLYPELYIAGGGSNIISQAKSVQWTVQIDSTGRFEPITDDYTIGEGNSLVIAKNVLEEHLSMLYRVEIIYHDRELDKDIIIQADMELVKLTNGAKGDRGEEGYTPVKGTDYFDGDDGQDGVSSYLWVRYSQSSNGDPMVTDPTDALYIGTATTHVSIAPQFPSEFTWTKVKGDQGIRGEAGDDGRTSYLHVKYSNDGGVTFTADNGESVGDWIGTYVDFTKDDSDNVGDYTWNKVKGDTGEDGQDGQDAFLLTIETPEGTSIRNEEGTLTAEAELFRGIESVTGETYKWYKRLPGASGDSDSGAGWSRLTSSNNYGTTGYNTATLTIPPEGITGSATYMVIVTYSGHNFRRQVTLTDITDPYTISILGDSFFRNGQGENTYTAKLYRRGEEVDENETLGYTYTWHQYSSTGDKIAGFEKTGKIITVSADEYQGKADLRVTVTR